MWPSFTIPEIYNRVLPNQPEPKWNGTARKTDAYLINLGTNEFNRPANPEEEEWVKAYCQFIARLRADSPNAVIYCALSPMLNDDWPPERKVRSTARNYLQRVVRECNQAGDARVRFLEFDQQNPNLKGLGPDWHPSVKTNQLMANKLTAAIKADLNW